MIMNNELKVGSEVVFFEGKDERNVAYTENGKVILCKHKIPLGYARIKSVQDKGKFYLVTAEHIVKDVYTGINYEDFMAVLPLHGFELGFDKTFENKWEDESDYTIEHQVCAYNPKNNVIIVAETFTYADENRVKFNSIEVWCPQLSVRDYSRCRLFYHGSNEMCVFDLERGYGNDGLLEWINKQMKELNSYQWPKAEYPNLWDYAEDRNLKVPDLGKRSLKKLLDAPKEIFDCFKGCKWVSELLAEDVA